MDTSNKTINITGNEYDFGYDEKLSYSHGPDDLSALVNEVGMTEEFVEYKDEFLKLLGKSESEVSVHYAIADGIDAKVCGVVVIAYEPENAKYGPSLRAVVAGDAVWDIIRRCLEIIGSGQLAQPTTFLLDYTHAQNIGLRQVKLSFQWNKDILPYMSYLIRNNLFKEVRVIGATDKNHMLTLMKSLANITTLTLPLLRNRIIFE